MQTRMNRVGDIEYLGFSAGNTYFIVSVRKVSKSRLQTEKEFKEHWRAMVNGLGYPLSIIGETKK